MSESTRSRVLPTVRALLAVVAVLLLAGCEEMTTVPDPPERAASTKPEPSPVVLKNPEVEQGLVSPKVVADLRNTSNKTVQAVTWWATFLDGNNRAVYGLAGQDVARFIWHSETIVPGGTARGTWHLTFFDLAVRVDETGVCMVTFTDGTQWEGTHDNC
jgi:hypothetical protein